MTKEEIMSLSNLNADLEKALRAGGFAEITVNGNSYPIRIKQASIENNPEWLGKPGVIQNRIRTEILVNRFSLFIEACPDI